MTDTPPRIAYGSEAAVSKIADALKQQAIVLRALRIELMQKDDPLAGSVVPILLMLQKACGSLYNLIEARQMVGAVLLARSALESVINAVYIRAVGEEADSKAKRHVQQKAYRDVVLYRRFLGDYLDDEQVQIDSELDSDLQELLDEFSFKSGREAPYWTPESLHDRVDAVERAFGAKPATILRIGISAIYRHSSELLHGTLYGALFALHQVPISQDIRSSKDVEAHSRQVMSMVSFLVICLIDQLIECFEIGEDSDLRRESNQLVSDLGKGVDFGN